MTEKTYECPFCDSKITKEKYDKVIRENEILKKKIEGLEKEREYLKIQESKLLEEKKNFEKKLKDAVNASRIKDQQKYSEEIKKLKENELKFKEQLNQVRSRERIKLGQQLTQYELIIRKQKDQIENLKKGKTAQELGFDFENEMYNILKKEFPDDEVEHTGKKGDALIKIKARNEIVGVILVECKRVEKHSPSHIDEVKRHKIAAKADVGILVTNGDFGKSKMDGFRNVDDILIIRPYSAVDFIRHIRSNLIEICSLKMTKEEKNKEMKKLWDFIHSTEFESQMNSILREINILEDLDSKEYGLLEKRKRIEENLLKAHKLISEGIRDSREVEKL